MAKVLLGVGRIGQSLTLPGFTQFGGAPSTANYTAEAMAARNFRVAGTFSDFAVKVDANGTSRHVIVRKNSADSVLDINPTDSTGGTFTDADTLAVTATDTINLKLSGSGTAFQLYWARLLFEASSGHVSWLGSSSSTAAASPLYLHFAAGTTNAVESATKLKMRGGGTLSYGAALVAVASGATVTIKLRKNGADGNTSISVTASTTGVFEDTSNTDTFADGDDLNWSLTGQTSSPALACGGIITWSKPQNDVFSYCFTFNGSASDQFVPIIGAHPAQTTESNAQIPHGFAVRVHHARIQIFSNTLGATETFRIRKNGADGNGTFTVASSTTGQFEDTTNTDLFSASDTICWKGTGATTGAANFVLGVSHSPTQTLSPSLYANTNTFPKPFIIWLTWDPTNKGTGISLSSNNRVAQSGDISGNATARAVLAKSSGKWYWEIKADAAGVPANPLGLIGSSTSLNNILGSVGNGARTSTAGTTVSGWTRDANSSFSAWTTNDIAMFALDMAAGKLWVGRNGTWLNSGDPAAGTGSVVSGISGTVFPATSPGYISFTNRLLVHADNFTYSIPSGFSAYGSGAVVSTIEPPAFENTNTFGTPTVSRGSVTLSPTKLTDGDTFYTQVITPRTTLSPSLYSDSDTFYTQVITPRTTLSPSLYSDGDTFGTPTVSRGSVTLSPTKLTDGDTFYTQVVTTRTTLSPSLYSDVDTFYQPIVSASRTLLPSLYADGEAFFTATVTPGAVTLQPALYANSQAFYTHSIALGSVTLSPPLYGDGDTFYQPTITVGSVTLSPSLFANQQTFRTQVISAGGSNVAPDLYIDGDTFYQPTVTRGAVTLQPSLFVDPDTFHQASLFAGTVLLPSLFVDGDSFYTHTVTPGARTLLPSLYADGETYYTPVVSTDAAQLLPSLYVDGDTFFTHVVTQRDRLLPALYQDADGFYSHTITQGGPTLHPGLFQNAQTYYQHLIIGGETTKLPAPRGDVFSDVSRRRSTRTTSRSARKTSRP